MHLNPYKNFRHRRNWNTAIFIQGDINGLSKFTHIAGDLYTPMSLIIAVDTKIIYQYRKYQGNQGTHFQEEGWYNHVKLNLDKLVAEVC